MDNVIYYLFILIKGNDSLANSLYKNKENKYDNIISNNQNLKSDSIWTCYLYLYNRLSILINNLIKSNFKNNIKELKILSKKIIDYTNNSVTSNEHLKDMFILTYFKIYIIEFIFLIFIHFMLKEVMKKELKNLIIIMI